MNPDRSLVLFSGGQDSTTCLYNELNAGRTVVALTLNYGQRHSRELQAASDVLAQAENFFGPRRVSHRVVDVPEVLIGDSPLTDLDQEVPKHDPTSVIPEGIESTFVPGRNLFFLAIAANYAAALGCGRIVTGVSQEDFGGYPDCRSAFITAFQEAMTTALGEYVNETIAVSTPLLFLNKMETVQLANSIPGCMRALAWSHTCYDGEYPPNPNNHASILRARGFRAAKIGDPLIARAISEGKLPQDHPIYGIY